jgi:hypothetical protein
MSDLVALIGTALVVYSYLTFQTKKEVMLLLR